MKEYLFCNLNCNSNAMMHLKIALSLLVLFNYPEQNASFKLDAKLSDAKWNCETICSTSGGKSEFKTETKICKCLLNKNVDDTDVQLMHKNAKILGIILETIMPVRDEKIIIKRAINMNLAKNQIEMTTSPINEDDTKNPNPEEIVGQQGPRRLRNGNQRRPTTQADQQRMIQQIREHLNHLSQNSDPRTRQTHIDAIRTNLRQLSLSQIQSVPTQEPRLKSRMSSDRSDRLRNIVQQVKDRQHKHHSAQHSPRVGATLLHHDGKDKSSKVEALENDQIQNPKFEIITQDPSLIDN